MLSKICLVFSLLTIITEGTVASESLCDNPVINSADRMINGTVRIYRGDQYWELGGLPDRKGWLSKPSKVWYQNLAPIHRNSSVMTCLVCNRKGYVFKFEGRKWWAWQTSGDPWKGGQTGEEFKYLPQSANGFDTVFHNSKTDEPLMIGLIGDKVFYYSTKGYFISPAPNYDPNGYVGGKFGEKFPSGMDASFSWPILKPEDGYLLFLFKGDKYCLRKEKAENGKQCGEWRPNRELFGCGMSAYPQTQEQENNQPKESEDIQEPNERNEPSESNEEPESRVSQNTSIPDSSQSESIIPVSDQMTEIEAQARNLQQDPISTQLLEKQSSITSFETSLHTSPPNAQKTVLEEAKGNTIANEFTSTLKPTSGVTLRREDFIHTMISIILLFCINFF